MSKHTKGEWLVYSSRTRMFVYAVVSGVTSLVATVLGCNAEEQKANARLIAAAPEMCELLAKLSFTTLDEPVSDKLLADAIKLLARIEAGGTDE